METLKYFMISTHFPPNHLGGDAVFVEYLSRELGKRGQEVHVLHDPDVFHILRHKRDHNGKPPDDTIVRHTIYSGTSTLGLVRRLCLGTPAKVLARLQSTFRDVGPDVVHWHNTKGFFGAPADLPAAVTLYTAHDYYSVCPRSNLLRPNGSICGEPKMCLLCNLRWKKPPQLWRFGGRRVLRFPKRLQVLSPSNYVASRLREERVANIHTLRNFVPDPGPWNAMEQQDNEAIIYLGMMERHKGPETLLNSFYRTRKDHGFVLNMVGDGPLKDRLARQIRTLKLNRRVRMHGFLSRSDLNTLRRTAIAQIVPSEWPENAPLTALEALSLGTPILSSDYGGLPEIAAPDSGCTVFKGEDQYSLDRSLVDLWNRRDDLSEARKLARKAFEEKYSPEVHLKSYLEIVKGDRRQDPSSRIT